LRLLPDGTGSYIGFGGSADGIDSAGQEQGQTSVSSGASSARPELEVLDGIATRAWLAAPERHDDEVGVEKLATFYFIGDSDEEGREHGRGVAGDTAEQAAVGFWRQMQVTANDVPLQLFQRSWTAYEGNGRGELLFPEVLQEPCKQQ
jgi:hypothetical protein